MKVVFAVLVVKFEIDTPDIEPVCVDGVAARACVIPVGGVAGRTITTLEGLGSAGRPHPVQSAFIEAQAAQCGYCANGMVMMAAALLAREPDADEVTIRRELSGNLCRCGAHVEIVQAVQLAARRLRGYLSIADLRSTGYAWDLLPYKERPLDLYRAHFWHAGFDHSKRTPFAAIYTSLGCNFGCDFCMINIVNRSDNGEEVHAAHSRGMRFWSTALEHRSTWTSLVPFCVKALMEREAPKQHHFRLWGSAICEPPTDNIFGVKTIGWWGMTETITHGIVGEPNQPNIPLAIGRPAPEYDIRDRKSTRLNSSH